MAKSKMNGDGSTGPTVAIIGAGISGLCVALALKRRGFHDFQIYEKSDGVGGTWYYNAYPGCRCDVGVVQYSHSRHPKWDWTESHPPRAELAAYWQDLAKTENLLPHIHLQHEMVSAKWNIERKRYDVLLSCPSGEEQVSSQYLVTAGGPFSVPAIPDIPGLESFSGPVIHTFRWPKDLTVERLKGKTVAVVGNACSGTQLVAELARAGDINVVAIARSHQWLIPYGDFTQPRTDVFSPLERRLHSVPMLLWLRRVRDYIKNDMNIMWFFANNVRARKGVEQQLTQWMKAMAPPELKEHIVPPFGFGAKRIIFDGGYLKGLNQPQVTPVWDTVVGLTSDSVVTASGKSFQADYVVFATGFDVGYFPNITGRVARTADTKPDRREQLRFYHTMALAGFPNFFTMLGGNANPSHASQLFIIETSAEYIATALVETHRAGIDVFEVKQSALDKYNAWLDRRLDKMVWNQARSYYRAEGGHGRVFTTWPASLTLFWWQNRHPVWNDYVGAEPLVKAQRARRLALAGGVVGILAGLWYCLV